MLKFYEIFRPRKKHVPWTLTNFKSYTCTAIFLGRGFKMDGKDDEFDISRVRLMHLVVVNPIILSHVWSISWIRNCRKYWTYETHETWCEMMWEMDFNRVFCFVLKPSRKNRVYFVEKYACDHEVTSHFPSFHIWI